MYCRIDKQRVSVCVSRGSGKRPTEILGKTTNLRNGKEGEGKGSPRQQGAVWALGNLKIKIFFLLVERV